MLAGFMGFIENRVQRFNGKNVGHAAPGVACWLTDSSKKSPDILKQKPSAGAKGF
jgi:hypothetical protein